MQKCVHDLSRKVEKCFTILTYVWMYRRLDGPEGFQRNVHPNKISFSTSHDIWRTMTFDQCNWHTNYKIKDEEEEIDPK